MPRRPLCCHFLTGRCRFNRFDCKYRHDADDGAPCCFGATCHRGHAARTPPARLSADQPAAKTLCCFFLTGTCSRPSSCYYHHGSDDGVSPCNFGPTCRRGHAGRTHQQATANLAAPGATVLPPSAPPSATLRAPQPPPAALAPLCCFHLGGSCKHPTDCRHRHQPDDGVSPCHFGARCVHGHAQRLGGSAERPLCCFFLGGVCKRTHGDCHYRHDADDGSSPCNFAATCRYGHANRTRDAQRTKADEPAPALAPRPLNGAICEICSDEAPLVAVPGCAHPPLHCQVCLTAHVTIRIREGRHSVTCPAVGCTQVIGVDLIQRLVSKADFDVLNDALTKRLLSQDQDVVFCSNAACATQVTVANGKSSPLVTCPLCRAKTCFLCHAPWHAGITCAEDREIRAEYVDAKAERLTAEYLRAETRHCPKCGTGPCMKTSAEECDVATCPRCQPRFRFCWSCGADYDVIFKTDCKSHKKGCRFYQ